MWKRNALKIDNKEQKAEVVVPKNSHKSLSNKVITKRYDSKLRAPCHFWLMKMLPRIPKDMEAWGLTKNSL